MKDLRLGKYIKRVDYSKAKPPKEHAIKAMLKNLHAAAVKKQ